MGVKARLDGHSFDLETLVRLFSAGDPRIGVDDEGYYLISSSFDAVSGEPGQLYRDAIQVLRRVNGIARAADTSFQPVQLVGRFVHGDGSVHTVVAIDTAHMRERAGVIVPSVNGVVSVPAPAGPNRADIARKHPDVAEAFDLLGDSVNYSWDDLLKVYEIVRANVGGTGNPGTDEQRLRATNWLPLSEHLGFYNSANTKSISGDAARHARGQPKTADTMTLPQGRDMINRLVKRWLDSLP